MKSRAGKRHPSTWCGPWPLDHSIFAIEVRPMTDHCLHYTNFIPIFPRPLPQSITSSATIQDIYIPTEGKQLSRLSDFSRWLLTSLLDYEDSPSSPTMLTHRTNEPVLLDKGAGFTTHQDPTGADLLSIRTSLNLPVPSPKFYALSCSLYGHSANFSYE